MHNGLSTQTSSCRRCCRGRPQVLSLTREDAPGSLIELVRCGECGLSGWRVDGAQVTKDRALAALSAVFASTAPKTRQRSARARPVTSTEPAPAPEPALATELPALLAGWQVLGAD